MTLSRAGDSVPYVSYATRTGCSSRPQSSGTGRSRSTNCVSTRPTEPAAGLDAGADMEGIISAVTTPAGSWLDRRRLARERAMADVARVRERDVFPPDAVVIGL